MFRHVAAFELKYQLKSPIFWGTSIIFFLLAFAAVASDDIRLGWGGQVYRNSPYAIAFNAMLWTIFAMFIVTAFVANVVLRDDETGFGPIIQATPLSKFDYLFGRFTGGFVAASLAYLSVPLAMLVVSWLPWIDPETLGSTPVTTYLYIYLLYCVPTLFVLGAGFFALATATRSILATYVGALVALAIYFFTSAYLNRPEFGALATLADPFGLGSFGYATKNWTAYDRNTMLPPFWGLVAENRAIWCGVALALLALAWRAFTKRGFQTRADRRPARNDIGDGATTSAAPAVSAASLQPPSHRALGWGPLAALTRFEMSGVLRSPIFIVLLGLALINQIIGLWYAGDDTVTVIYPVTRVMIQTLSTQFLAIPLFVAAFYAGELVWRDRERRMHEIVDSTPAPDWTFLVPKILAIATVLLGMGLASIVAAIAVQLLKGFTAIEYSHYLTWYLAPWLLTMVMYTVLAVFVQTLVPHKFVGLLVVLLYFVLETALPTMGLESHLYIYATASRVPFSDMNGLGKFAGFAAWYRAYWAACAVILTVLAYGLWRRGASAPLMVRIRMLPGRLAGTPALIAGVAAVAMAGLGSWIYYNNYVLNRFPTYNESQRWAADFEKQMKIYVGVPQPRITDVRLNLDLFPDVPKVTVHGTYVIENKTGKPLTQVYLTWLHPTVSKSFLGTLTDPGVLMKSLDVQGGHLTKEIPRFNFRIYTLDTPMAPGERREIHFVTERERKGFVNEYNEDRLVHNGTFLDNFRLTPQIGIDKAAQLHDRATRRRFGLDPNVEEIKLGDPRGREHNYLRHDSDFVWSDITMNGPADQVLLAPGQQISRTVHGDRQTVRFKSEAPIANFFSVQAAKYAVYHDHYKNIGIEVYYHPPHKYNVERFASIAKDALKYYTTNFSPYQFKQFRIIEFPDYNNFAQAFPGAVPYSEAAGFVSKIDDKKGIDFVAYVTAHELGHQWWFHQITGADMEGSTVLSETLAQYSSIMVMEHRYGQAMIRRFNKQGADGYLRARGKENVAEPPLEKVQEQAYVRYAKGGVVMYLLKDQLGEDKVNAALRSLLKTYAFKGAPYPTALDLVAALRAEARPDQQQLITDLFEKITLYDLKVNDAEAVRRPDGKWTLTLTVEAHKRYSDGKGIETEAPLDAMIDIGVFTAQPSDPRFGDANVLSLAKQRITTGVHKIVLVVDRQPTFAGIDPYLKYIDRASDDNVAPVKAH